MTAPQFKGQVAVQTYRYLRVALIALIALISVAVFREHAATKAIGSCFQTSISAYYYTPAQAVFVGALVAIGVCLIALQGNTEVEDVLLNLAGMLAPVVAFVPTPAPVPQCWSVPRNDDLTWQNVANNMFALFVVGAIALVWAGISVLTGTKDAAGRRVHQWHHLIGLGAGAAIYLAFGLWYRHPASFLAGAHYTAAVPMYVLFGAVVFNNAYSTSFAGRPGSPLVSVLRWLGPLYFRIRSPYAAVAALMVWSLVVLLILPHLFTWRHALLWLEFAEIGLFAVFWVLETIAQWNEEVTRLPVSPGIAFGSGGQGR